MTDYRKDMCRREDVVFAGGCAKNACLRAVMEERLQRPLLVDEHPDMLAALGAALYAAVSSEHGHLCSETIL